MNPPPQRPPWLGRIALGWAFVLLLASAGWVLGGRFWIADLLGNLAAHLVVLDAAFGALFALLRLSRGALVAGFAAAVAAGACLPPRAARGEASGPGETVTIVLFNGSSARLERSGEALEVLLAAEPDVLILVEPSTALLEAIRSDARLEGWDGWIPEDARSGWRVVLTRWEQQGGDHWTGGARQALHAGMHAMVVNHPRTPFGLVQFHPASPRTAARWREGNETTRDAATLISARLLPLAIPVLAGGDLNSTPSGWRSRWFGRETGLRRAKPRWASAGTFPTALPGLVRVAIDDIFVSRGVEVSSWRLLPFSGSDHAPVRIELRLPGPQATASEESRGSSSEPKSPGP